MTREEFIKVLEDGGYPYEIEGDKIVVTYDKSVYLESLETLPPGVEFKNGGSVWLNVLTTLPAGVWFENVGSVYLNSLKTIHPGVEFNNKGIVNLNSLIGCLLNEWKGLIKGISSKRLLNGMIKRGVFI